MVFKPAPLEEGQISKLREYEQQLSQEAGAPIILIAYSEKEAAENLKESFLEDSPVEKKRP